MIVKSTLGLSCKATVLTLVVCSEVGELGKLGADVTLNVIVKSTLSFGCKVTLLTLVLCSEVGELGELGSLASLGPNLSQVQGGGDYLVVLLKTQK